MARPSDARSRLIRTAAALFRQRGYDGVGLTEILTASGAPKGSFYHHFPEGKEQLAEACVRYAGGQFSELIDLCFAQAPDFASGLRHLVGAIAEWFERTGFREGCPITAVALATVPQSPVLAEATRAVIADWRERFTGHGRRFGVAFTAEDDDKFFMLMEGAWILGRIQQSAKPIQRAGEIFLEGHPSAIAS